MYYCKNRIPQIIIAASLLLTGLPLAKAEEIYQWTDKQGKVLFSTSPVPPSQGHSSKKVAAKLPPLFRENLSAKIQQLKYNTPATCNSHGGLDCSQGADSDGSVICLDGFRGSKQPFNFSCLETKLKVSDFSLIYSKPGTPSKAESVPVKKLSSLSETHFLAKALRISIRNTAGVKAKDVQIKVKVGNKLLKAQGEDHIPPYGANDYEVNLSNLKYKLFTRDISKASYRLRCKNCR